jgi:hypothetical protein
MGNPGLVVTDEIIAKVERLASTGLNLIQIGQVLGYSERAMFNYKKKYPELDAAWRRGKYKAIAQMANVIYKNAIEKEETAAAKYWLDRQGGTSWKDAIDVNLVPKPMIIERFSGGKEVVLGVEDGEIIENDKD